MTLDTYLSRKGSLTLTALSKEIGVSVARLSQLRNSKSWPPALALAAEQATDGKLNASKICPVVALARRTAAPTQSAA